VILSDVFPKLADEFPQLLNWTAGFNWDTEAVHATADFLDCQIRLQNDHDQLLRFSQLLRSDIIEQTSKATDEQSGSMIDGMRFIVSQVPLYRTMAMGQLGDCYDWTLWAISRNHNPEQRMNSVEYRLPPYDGASEMMNEAAIEYVVDWVKTAYLLARKFGGLDALCGDFLKYGESIARRAVACGDSLNGLEALVAIVSWAVGVNHPKTKELTQFLEKVYYSKNLQPRERVIIGMVFVTQASEWTHKKAPDWANEILAQNRENLREHETLQLLGVSIDSLNTWQERSEEILIETHKLAFFYRTRGHSKMDALIALESRVAILYPIIYGLCRFGSINDIMGLLWAWYGNPDWKQADPDVLFISPNQGGGVRYVWKGGSWASPNADVAGSLEELLIVASSALNDYFRGPSGDRVQFIDPRLEGTPAIQHGAALLAKMEEHYRFASLSERLPNGFHPRSVVVIPAHRDPLQAILAGAVGRLIPFETSFAEADFDRRIGTISIWPGSTQLTQAEIEVLKAVAKIAGWRVKMTKGILDADAFNEFYLDPDPDVLWVIGHGEHSPHQHGKSGLILADDVLLPMARIEELNIPGPGRRLLVLNICSGASTQTSGGAARVGLGQTLVTPRQQVVAHLWPIDYYSALAFGCAFSYRLSKSSPSAALLESMDLMRNQSALLSELASLSPSLEAIDRLQGERINEQLISILSWGCPSLMI
jgi:hypothetical protein